MFEDMDNSELVKIAEDLGVLDEISEGIAKEAMEEDLGGYEMDEDILNKIADEAHEMGLADSAGLDEEDIVEKVAEEAYYAGLDDADAYYDADEGIAEKIAQEAYELGLEDGLDKIAENKKSTHAISRFLTSPKATAATVGSINALSGALSGGSTKARILKALLGAGLGAGLGYGSAALGRNIYARALQGRKMRGSGLTKRERMI